jgi:hypothetical protein
VHLPLTLRRQGNEALVDEVDATGNETHVCYRRGC